MSIVNFLTSTSEGFEDQLSRLLGNSGVINDEVERVVDEILLSVLRDGDRALIDYTKQFDRVVVSSVADLSIDSQGLAASLKQVDGEVLEILSEAAGRIEDYHQHQLQKSWSYKDELGNTLGQRITPLDRVGLYVPGGTAAYPSSVLMNAIPAKVAGVEDVIMVAPTPDGLVSPVVLAAAHIAGVKSVLKIGGAQAIAALAYGTQSVKKVDKIVGPGNAYVASAKKKVFGSVGIDMIAGPSEILIICDGKTDVDWVVMDLFAQAEHDELAQSILISDDLSFLEAVRERIPEMLERMPRKAIIENSLRNRGVLILAEDLMDACEISNRIAPEHLELSVDDPQDLVESIDHAGAIFMGRYASESLGDYCAGPNHVLPTSGTARFSSPLGVYDFQKRSSLINVSENGARKLGIVAAKLAREEGLEAHALAAEQRSGR